MAEDNANSQEPMEAQSNEPNPRVFFDIEIGGEPG